MMIPITRKEKYINEIVGGGDTAPKTPQTREEFFFAEILGEVIAPSPVTRVEKYLSAIAGQFTAVLPEPVTRIERFIARAAGMDVTIHTPITREEIFWSNYSAIVDFEVEGVPPLTYKAIEGTLKNYRIYGNTVNGNSVGDRTRNLFDGEFLQGCWAGADGSYLANYPTWICTDKLPCKPNTAYTLSFNSANSRWYGFFWFAENGDYILSDTAQSPQTQCHYTATSPSNAAYMAIDIAGYPDIQSRITPSDVTDFMLVEGTTPLPYEPYGYRIPITLTAGSAETTNIYLDEPLAKSGNNADYIDYATQKRQNSDGTESSVTLPEISTLAGTNTLTVGTEVQPSNVYIKYEGAR